MDPVQYCRVYHHMNKYTFLADTNLDKPFVVYLHGSHGFTKHNVLFIKLLCSLGFLVVAPDHTQYNFCPEYNTSLKTIQKNRKIYKCIINLRLQETERILNYLNTDITLIGSSEGGVITSISNNKHIKKKIISSYSAEPTYFYRKCLFTRPDMEIINIIGSHDGYFGRYQSIMQKKHKYHIGHASYCLLNKSTRLSNVYVIKNGLHNYLFDNYRLAKQILSFHLGCQTKFNTTKIRNIVLQNKRIVWFQIKLNCITQISALGEQIYILQSKHT